MRHRLLVLAAIGREFIAHMPQRLAHARHIAVPEDRPHAGEDRQLLAIDDGHLRRHEPDERLRGGETDGLAHVLAP